MLYLFNGIIETIQVTVRHVACRQHVG